MLFRVLHLAKQVNQPTQPGSGRWRLPYLALAALLAAGASGAANAQGQMGAWKASEHAATSPTAQSEAASPWDVTLGLGLGVRPTYVGSDKSTTIFVPWIDINYDDWLSLDARGLSAYWHTGKVKVGAGLTQFQGRDDEDSSSLITQGDDRLAGMGELKSATAARAFASYQLGRIKLSAAIEHSLGDSKRGDLQMEGTLVRLAAFAPYQLNEQWTLMASVGADWVNEDYMQSLFGVNATQAVRSQFTAYTPDAGLKSVGVAVGASYQLSKHWSIMSLVHAKKLMGDAADSPLVYEDTNTVFVTTVNYRF